MPKTEKKTVAVACYECARCGHSWVPRSPERPLRCPKCKTCYWDRPVQNPDLVTRKKARGRKRG